MMFETVRHQIHAHNNLFPARVQTGAESAIYKILAWLQPSPDQTPQLGLKVSSRSRHFRGVTTITLSSETRDRR